MTVTYTTDGGLIGVSFLSAAEGGSGGLDGGFGGAGGLPTFGLTFLARLTSSLILDTGSGNPTWSRATKAWRFNELGYLDEVAAGAAVFGGTRSVRNTVRTKSEDFSIAGWVKSGGMTVSGATILVCANSTAAMGVSQSSSAQSVISGQHFLYGARVKHISGGADFVQICTGSIGFASDYMNVSLLDGSYATSGGVAFFVTEIIPGTYDIALRAVADTTASGDYFSVVFSNGLDSPRNPSFVGDGVKSFELLRTWAYNVTNYAMSYIPEYIPVGVDAAPYYGAGTDGIKYFETDWQGASIAAGNLLGFRREVAATNNLLYCRDLSTAEWATKTNITATKTATGLDGLANTATILTATATDAIILQPITLASAARCASAYVKRRTGTGTIFFTQDGGSSWTNITSLINNSTWSRVEITATLANPSVGFKLSTSGDAIDVDCAQNEAGLIATSLIVTTTATVTRNAESLAYQTTSNWSDTAGTAYIKTQPLSWVAGGAVGNATNGLLLSAANSGATASDGTNTTNGPTGTPSGLKKLAMNWGSSAITVASGGLVGTAGNYDGAMGLTNIGVGVNSSGYFTQVAIYNYAMTNAELQAITS